MAPSSQYVVFKPNKIVGLFGFSFKKEKRPHIFFTWGNLQTKLVSFEQILDPIQIHYLVIYITSYIHYLEKIR